MEKQLELLFFMMSDRGPGGIQSAIQIEYSAGFRFNPDRDEWHSTNEEPIMSRVTPARNRQRTFKEQKGRCYYCGVPMWLDDPSGFTAKYGIREKQAKHFSCTAGHLLVRQDGGTNALENIVAACHFCNSRRHRGSTALPPERYREKVVGRLLRGMWHPMEYCHML